MFDTIFDSFGMYYSIVFSFMLMCMCMALWMWYWLF